MLCLCLCLRGLATVDFAHDPGSPIYRIVSLTTILVMLNCLLAEKAAEKRPSAARILNWFPQTGVAAGLSLVCTGQAFRNAI